MKIIKWLDDNFEEFILVILLLAMTLIMGIQVFTRYLLGNSLAWSEEITRYLFIWSGFISVSYCTKKCISIGMSSPVHILNAAAPWNNIIPIPFIVLHPTSLAILNNSVSLG